MKLTVISNTIVKIRPEPSSTLKESEKSSINAGVIYNVLAYKEEKEHYKVTLDGSTILGRNTVFFWKEHVSLGVNNNVKLGVKFFPQTDNKMQPDRTCNSSVHAMLLNYLKPGTITGDDQYIDWVFKLGDTTDHSIHTQLLRRFGIDSVWRTDLDFDDLDKSLENGYPVPIGIVHRGTESNPTGGGHIILVIGKNTEGYIIHDPYGSILDNYTRDVQNGNGVVYSQRLLTNRWLLKKANNGWGRLITKVF